MRPASRSSFKPASAQRRSLAAACLPGILVSGAALALTGCGVTGHDVTSATPDVIVGRQINGNVHGGAYPIQNASIHLLETQNNGYGGAGKDLLKPLAITVTSDKLGNFTIPDSTWTCDSGQYAYVTVTGGYTTNLGTTTANNNVVQVAAIGPCADLATSASGATINRDTINLFISELSTVAAAYALGNFMTIKAGTTAGQQIVNISAPAANNAASPLCSGTGTKMTCTAGGLGHAFQNAFNLVDAVRLDNSTPSGTARFVNPTNSASTIPAPLINTLGNILQSCVDSIGGAGCSDLFTYTTPSGGTAPTNTLQAAINMANYPTTNVSNLFGLQKRAVFFTPNLDAAPSSLALTIFYGQTSSTTTQFPYPVDLAVDAADNLYILYGSAAPSAATVTGVVVLAPDGTQLGKGTANYGYPSQIAVDIYGNTYVTNNDATTGAVLRGSYSTALAKVATLTNASGLAIDAGSNVWVSADNTTSPSYNRYNYATMSTASTKGTIVAPDFQSAVVGAAISGLAIDPDEDIWGVSNPTTGNTLATLLNNNSGDVDNPTYTNAANGYVQKTLGSSAGFSVAPSAGTTTTASAYFPTSGELDYLTVTAPASGLLLTAGATKTVSTAKAPHRSEVDGAGNVFWTDLEATGAVYKYTPTTTPATTAGTYISVLPCYPIPDGAAYACLTPSATQTTNLRGMAIDSAGDVWFAGNTGLGLIFEMIGMAQPTWPQLSLGKPGVMPQ